jgi:hypothetical protein
MKGRKFFIFELLFWILESTVLHPNSYGEAKIGGNCRIKYFRELIPVRRSECVILEQASAKE